jgi:phosphoribosylamine--glycine ligase
MKIIVVGSGGREHALAWRLSCGGSSTRRPDREVIVAPGNAGVARTHRCLPARTVNDLVEICRAERPDLVVVGPEAWLDMGAADLLALEGFACFGPSAAAARLESSKAFMKDVVRAAGVPTADFVVVTEPAQAEEFFAARAGRGAVIKADGLCAGKGVVVCGDVNVARAELATMLGHGGCGPRFGAASSTVVVEDLLPGEELSVFALCSDDDAVVLGAARDHKRLRDNDEGPNTGGMGAVGPLGDDEGVSAAFLEDLRQRFFLPTLRELKSRGLPFRGVLFAGLMVDAAGTPWLLEYNVRFGDPETEALLWALDVDLAPVLLACAIGATPQLALPDAPAKGAVVVVAAEGYPEAPEKGAPIVGVVAANGIVGAQVFFAGVGQGAFGLVVDGGRVLAVAGRGNTFDDALDCAYAAVDQLQVEGAQVRRDIGKSVRRR